MILLMIVIIMMVVMIAKYGFIISAVVLQNEPVKSLGALNP